MGGDLQHVKDGVGELRIVEVKSERAVDRVATLTKDAGMRKVVVNVPATLPELRPGEEEGAGAEVDDVVTKTSPPPVMKLEEVKMVNGVKIYQGTRIGGKCIEYPKGYQGVALLKVREGLWEQKRGVKVDGGERRRAEVRAKRRVQERKNAR